MARLLLAMIQEGISFDYPAALLRALAEPPAARAGTRVRVSSSIAPGVLLEPLSDRETEVLRLLAQGLSNREIAQRLYISLPTVKSHTSHIYQKLGVHDRHEAVARARALNLL